MIKSLRAFFAGNFFSLVAVLVCSICSVCLGVFLLCMFAQFGMVATMLPTYSLYFVQAVVILCLYFSYRTHNKNVMKGLLGSELMLLLIQHINLIPQISGTIDGIFTYVALALILGLCINHFIINSDRHSRPYNIIASQILAVLWLLVEIAWTVQMLLSNPDNSFQIIVLILTALSAIYTIVYVETKLDTYRELREKAGWTEKTGYPEDYDRTANYGK